MTETTFDPSALSLRAAAAYAGVSEGRMRTLLREGKIPGARKGDSGEGDEEDGVWLVPVEGLDEWEASKSEGRQGGAGKPGTQVRVIGLTPESRAALENFVATNPAMKGASITKAHYTETAEQRKAREERKKAEQAQIREALKAQGIVKD